jgi:hypothetical protein
MTRTACLLLAILYAAAIPGARADASTTETIVMVRHGEKPAGGLGQLSCQGLNRALALGGVLARQFGRPDAVFAPDPSVTKEDHGVAYDYVRPLATIEPAAVAFGLPVHAGIGVRDIAALQTALDAPALAGATVVVAWEHSEIVALARNLMAAHGGIGSVPDWDRRDYDGIYVVRVVRDGPVVRSSFGLQREGLDGLSATCPG